MPDWQKFHDWELKYEIKRFKSLTPRERIRIHDDLYKTALRILGSKIFEWHSDKYEKTTEHIKYLTEPRKYFLRRI